MSTPHRNKHPKPRMINTLLLAILSFCIGVVLGLFLYQLLVNTGKSSDIANPAIALGGLLVALVATLTSYFQRADPQRQSLYQAHLDAYQEIYYALLDVISRLLDLTTDEANENTKSNFKKSWDRFYQASRRHWVILPAAVRDALIKQEKVINDIHEKISKDRNSDVSSDARELGIANMHVFDMMRETLGIERLHGETAQLIGIPERQTER
jgi:hypothetical protein